MASEKISMKETINLTMRGYKIWFDRYPMMLISQFICSVAESITPYVGIYISAQLINEIAGTRDRDTLIRLVLISLISAAVLRIFNSILWKWRDYHSEGYWYKRSKLYADKMMSMDFNKVDDSHTHDLLSQIRQNENWSGWGLPRLFWSATTIISSITNIIGAVVLTVTLFTQHVPDGSSLTVLNNPLFMVAIIAIMLTITFISPMIGNKANSYWPRHAENAKMGNRMFSFFGFMGYNRSRALDIRMYRQDMLCEKIMNIDMGFSTKSGIAKYARGPMGLLNVASAVLSQVFTGVVYVFVCLKAWGGAFGVGSVTQYISAITSLSGALASLVSLLGNFKNNAVFLRTTFEFFDIPNDMYQGSLTVEKRSDKKYDIEFRNVSFKYPNTDNYVLRNVSIKFKIGERLAVVGMNGSGKTTFIKLLCRLYDPDEGEILLNGIDIRKYDYDEYMSVFAVVFQDFKLTAFKLGQNVAACVDYDADKVTKCLTDAGFGNRLETLDDKLETYLYKNFDDKGVDISGGEAQKIALARTLYKEASFVILDEPTAALDPIAEYEVYSKMNDIVGDRTAVFISHRLSSCRFCHNIAVFHDGDIVQYGSHDSLLADESGKYHELWNAQAQYYNE